VFSLTHGELYATRYSWLRTYSRTDEAFSVAGRAGGPFGPSGTSTLPGGGATVDVSVGSVCVSVGAGRVRPLGPGNPFYQRYPMEVVAS
jgi:hypothetical protein